MNSTSIVISAVIEAALYGAILLTPLWFPKRWINAVHKFFTDRGL